MGSYFDIAIQPEDGSAPINDTTLEEYKKQRKDQFWRLASSNIGRYIKFSHAAWLIQRMWRRHRAWLEQVRYINFERIIIEQSNNHLQSLPPEVMNIILSFVTHVNRKPSRVITHRSRVNHTHQNDDFSVVGVQSRIMTPLL